LGFQDAFARPGEGVLVPRVSQPLVGERLIVRNPLSAHLPGQWDPNRHLRKATANLDIRGPINICQCDPAS